MNRKVVLIVDDDVDIREILAETLGNMDFDCTTAVNGLDALTVLRTMPVPPSIILLDLMMPVMDGYGFLEQRRRDAALASIPLAIVTAGRGIDRNRFEGNIPVIEKPFDVDRLVRFLHAVPSEVGPPP